MKNFNSIITLFLPFCFLLVGCQKTENNNVEDKITEQEQSYLQVSKLPKDAIGLFNGGEPAYSMKVGNQMIPMSSSKWRMEISENHLNLQQVSDGQTIYYSGKFIIESDNEISVTIIGDLLDDKYSQSFTPTLKFYKALKSWFLEGVMGSEGCSLSKK